jgi:hypothetical protein
MRSVLPYTRSLLMDDRTLEAWKRVAVAGRAWSGSVPPGLTAAERSAFETCAAQNSRIEQEPIPQAVVNAALNEVLLYSAEPA